MDEFSISEVVILSRGELANGQDLTCCTVKYHCTATILCYATGWVHTVVIVQQMDHQIGAHGGIPIAVCVCVVLTAGAYSELTHT